MKKMLHVFLFHFEYLINVKYYEFTLVFKIIQRAYDLTILFNEKLSNINTYFSISNILKC